MAFFKFRKGGDDHPVPPPALESVEAMRKRAKHRLMGAAVLVLLGVIGFPLLFDNQPRPIPVDLPIEIPDRNKVKPLGNLPVGNAAGQSTAVDESAPPVAAAASPVVAATSSSSRAAEGTVAAAAVPAAVKPAVKPLSKSESKSESPGKPPAVKPETAKTDTAKADNTKADNTKAEAAKAKSLLEGKEAPAAAAASSRFVVQVGAFSDGVKAHEVRARLEAAGLKTYTQVVEPKEGKRIRVRVGPFENKADADKAAARVRKLDMPAAILEL